MHKWKFFRLKKKLGKIFVKEWKGGRDGEKGERMGSRMEREAGASTTS